MDKEKIYEINSEAVKFYRKQLPDNQNALTYLYQKRKLNDKTLRAFLIGYAPDGWRNLMDHMIKLGYTVEQLLEAHLICKSEKTTNYYDYFRNRIIFPISDIYGNIIGFGGRKINDDDYGPKYLNSAESSVFSKRLNLYGLNIAKNHLTSPLILCEGYMDCIAMQKAGFKTAVAGLGTALTPEQVLLISSLTDKVILAYDADEAGIKATKKAIELFEEETSIVPEIIKMKGAKDADEFINKFGSYKFREEILNKTISIFDFRMDYINTFENDAEKFDKGINVILDELMKLKI